MPNSKESAVIVIPARMTSTRFPNKPLAMIKGMTMIERVYRIAKTTAQANEVIIATDDEGLKAFAEKFGATVIMTSPDCLTGTDRVAEVSHLIGNDHTIFFSLQGDAVLTPPWVIENVLQSMLENPEIQIATPAVRLNGEALLEFIESKKGGSSSGTTVAFNKKGDALYFSKSLIPYDRSKNILDRVLFRHIGLYGFRREVLQNFAALPEGVFEKSEKLEQLRALENGIPIRVIQVDYKGRTHGSVDLPEDIVIVENIIGNEGGAMPLKEEKPIHLILVRHGNTFEAGQVPTQVGLKTDLSLTSTGKVQAQDFGKYLVSNNIIPAAIYAGGLKRQIESAKIIAEYAHVKNLYLNETALNEIDYGPWENLPSEEITAKWPKEYKSWTEQATWAEGVFGGSLKGHMYGIELWIAHLRNTYMPGDVVLGVTSNGLIRFFYAFNKEIWNQLVEERLMEKHKVKTGHFCELLLYPDHFDVKSWNIAP